MHMYLSEVKLAADVMTSSILCTCTGIFLHPGDLRTRINSFIVSWRTLAGHISIFVTTTNTGTLKASARPRCSKTTHAHLKHNPNTYTLEGYVITFGHTNDASIGSNHQHTEVWGMASHSKYCCLEVLLVTSKINKGDDFCRGSADVNPVQATMTICLIDNFTFTIKTQYIIANTWCPPSFHLMFVSKEPLSSCATPIVQLTMSQHSKQCTLASINVAHHSHPGGHGNLIMKILRIQKIYVTRRDTH